MDAADGALSVSKRRPSNSLMHSASNAYLIMDTFWIHWSATGTDFWLT